MSFLLEALRDKPLGLWTLEGPAPYQDRSGYNRTGTVTGTPVYRTGTVNGINKSVLFRSSAIGAFPSPVFIQGFERQSFSLEAWIRPFNDASTEVQILGTQNNMDGITVIGAKVAFTTKYLTAPPARVEFDLQQRRAVHVIGVHTAAKNALYVNGVLVGETTLTEQQQADKFAATNGSLYSGTTAATGNYVSTSSLGVYGQALSIETITRHYLTGIRVPNGEAVIGGNGGNYIPLSVENAKVFLDQWWSTAENWSLGSRTGTAVVSDQLVPQFVDDTSIAGYWIDSLPLDSTANATSIYGVVLNWDGEGATVEVSFDTSTWETVTRGTKINLVPEGFNPTDKLLFIRVSFSGGIVADPSYMDNLNVVGLLSGVSPAVAGRTVTMTNATQERTYRPLELHDNWGVESKATGTVSISADTSVDATPARTIEFWIKPTTTFALSMTGTQYVNGVATATLPNNVWSLVHIVAPANVTIAIDFSGEAQIGQVGIYETALTAAQIAEIFAEYTQTNTWRVGDNSVINMTESAQTVKVYAHDWTILASG